jgi:Spy/CpxP family protein refolding chaperone
MNTSEISPILARLFAELTTGAPITGAFIVNAGDPGLLASLDKLSAAEASHNAYNGATIAAHAAHVSYGLSLMNRWASEGGNPFADAHWQQAWKITSVDDRQWQEIRDGLRKEVLRWQEALRQPRDVMEIELSGMIGSIAHTAYHLGAIRQINSAARGPKDPSEK